jgi:hypothetical protein
MFIDSPAEPKRSRRKGRAEFTTTGAARKRDPSYADRAREEDETMYI